MMTIAWLSGLPQTPYLGIVRTASFFNSKMTLETKLVNLETPNTENTHQDTEIATQPIKTPEIATQPVKTPEIDGQKSDLDIFLDTLPQPLSKEEGLLRIVVRQKGLGILTQPIKDMGGSVKDGGCYGAYGSLAVFHCNRGLYSGFC